MNKLEKELQDKGYKHVYSGYRVLVRRKEHYVLYSVASGKMISQYGKVEKKK